MVSVEAILVLDLGNSSTKVTVMHNKDKDTGRYQERSFELSNTFAPLEEDYEISSDYNDRTSTVLRLNEEFCGISMQGLYCNGDLQMRERPTATIKPSAKAKKWELDATLLSIKLAFLRAYKEVMTMRRVTDPTQLEIKWDVVAMLPPGDIDVGKGKVIDIIKGVTSVDATFPEMHCDITVNKVSVYPEGFGAYVAVVYDRGCTIREKYGFLKDETILVFDIGAGTTDCLIISNNAMIQDSKYTIDLGGNNVSAQVKKWLRSEGYDVNNDVLAAGLISGAVKVGATSIDITDAINRAKADTATKIVAEFDNYLDTTDVKISQVGYILPAGGGSTEGDSEKGIHSLSEYLLKEVRRIARNAEIIDLPKVKQRIVNEETGETTVTEGVLEARMLNIIGACVLAELG